MVKKINQKIVLVVLIVIFLFLIQKEEQEHFIDGNFSLCEKTDCECLKMKRAPDGTCIDYKMASVPATPAYKDKKLFMKHVVRNNLYPLKKKLRYINFCRKRNERQYQEVSKWNTFNFGWITKIRKRKT